MSIDAIFNSSVTPVLEQVVSFTQDRHQILAGNIANLDTPGYRTRDLSPEKFHEQLKEAIATRDSADPGQSLGDPQAFRSDPFRDVSRERESILFHDQSNIGLEQQITEMSKNQGTHNQAIALLEHQFQLLRAAISERA